MLFNLVKKDFILAKKYLLFLLIFTIGAPIFITSKMTYGNEGFLSFFITALFGEHMLFNTISMSEDKSKGSSLLCATPYTRNVLVKAKYVFILVSFICTYIIYTLTTFIPALGVVRLNIFDFGISLLIITIYFAIIIPLRYQFGYEKTRYISSAFIFISPFAVPSVIKWLQSKNINFQITLPFPQIFQDLLPCLLGIIIAFASMIISTHIYSKKNL